MYYHIKNLRTNQYIVLGKVTLEGGYYNVDLTNSINKENASTKWEIHQSRAFQDTAVHTISAAVNGSVLIDNFGPTKKDKNLLIKIVDATYFLYEEKNKLNLYFSTTRQNNVYRMYSVDRAFALSAYNINDGDERLCMVSGLSELPDTWLLEEAN